MSSDSPGRLVRLYRELKRRRVLGSTAAYIVLAGLLMELSDSVFDALLFPPWTSRLVTVLLILGLPIVVVLAWFFDVSAAGLTRTESASERGPERGAAAVDGGGVASAFRRSQAVPIPEAPYRGRGSADRQGRRPAVSEAEGGEPAAEPESGPPDPERVRRATLGHVRHELRTPINAIMGYSEMLLEDADDARLREDLNRIRTAGRQLLERVDGLLSPERVAPEALQDMDTFADQVSVDLRTPVSAVVGYAEMLMESCEEEGRRDLLEDLERILAAARRLLAASGDIAGMAAMVRGVGDAAVASRSALTEGVLAKIRPVEPGEGNVEGVGRLLVVDDNDTNRDLISRQLARHGYTVATAADGRQALDLLDQQSFDLILLDVIMPEMDGVETLRRICISERLRGTPVIMLSSLNETDSAVRCIEMGAQDYVSKPIQPTLLEARIAAALEIRELRRRETAYRQRVASDGELIERLLMATVPASLRERVRAGSMAVEEYWADAVVVRCRVPATLRATGGTEAVDRVREIRELLVRVENVARTHGADAVLARRDGFVAVLRGNGGGSEAAASAARLVLDTRAAWDGIRARFGMDIGETVIGIVGEERPRLEVWGQAVDAVAGLSAGAGDGTVLVTPAVEALLKGRFSTVRRGVVEIRGAGQMRVHELTGELEAAGEAEAADGAYVVG